MSERVEAISEPAAFIDARSYLRSRFAIAAIARYLLPASFWLGKLRVEMGALASESSSDWSSSGGVCALLTFEVDVAVGRVGDLAGSSCHIGIHGGLVCSGVDGSSSTIIVGGRLIDGRREFDG